VNKDVIYNLGPNHNMKNYKEYAKNNDIKGMALELLDSKYS
jgi:hypothetical protein